MARDDTKFRGTRFVTVVLVALLLVSAALLVQAILIQIDYKPQNWPHWITRHAVLDTDAAIALIVGLITVLGVIWQFKEGLRPILNNSRDESFDKESRTKVIDVEVENSGLGPAIISRSRYELLRRGEEKSELYDDIGDLRAALEKLGYAPDRYEVCGFSPRTSIRKEGTREVAHLPRDVVNRVAEINVILSFRSVFGGRYTEKIKCLPPATEAASPGWYFFPEVPGTVAWWDGTDWNRNSVRSPPADTTDVPRLVR
jgi:hypothetical protein